MSIITPDIRLLSDYSFDQQKLVALSNPNSKYSRYILLDNKGMINKICNFIRSILGYCKFNVRRELVSQLRIINYKISYMYKNDKEVQLVHKAYLNCVRYNLKLEDSGIKADGPYVKLMQAQRNTWMLLQKMGPEKR